MNLPPTLKNSFVLFVPFVTKPLDRDCATSEKSELKDSFIKPTLLAELKPSNDRWPFDNIGKSTQVLCRSGVESCLSNGSNDTRERRMK